jgi:hypothetical protein
MAAAGVLASCSSSGPAVKFRAATKEFFSEGVYGKPARASFATAPCLARRR